MQLEEIIQRIQSLYSEGAQSKDSRLTSQHIYNALKTARSTLLRQQSGKGQMISHWNYQTLPCVELIKGAMYDCPSLPDMDCTILKSKHPLPKAVVGLSDILIGSITTVDGSIYFDPTTFETVKHVSGNKYTGRKPKYFITNNGHLGITIYQSLKAVTLSMLAEDPLEALMFPSVCRSEEEAKECECINILEWEFPLDNSLSDAAIKMASNELIIMFKQMGEDKTADASDNGATSGSMIHQPQQQQAAE